MEIIKRLNSKREELEERLSNLYHGGSQRRETLQYRIKRIDDLIDAYESKPSSVNLSEAKEILNQQVGFEEQKKKVLEFLEIAEFRELRNIQKFPLILCLIGPTGIGKTTFAQILSQALNKKFYSVSLGGLSDSSVLVGTSENSSGTEIGQLTKALTETKTRDPLILLDEIDKSGTSFKTSIQDCLLNILDAKQNQEVLDHYLDVKLDFSQVNFVVTANDLKKIPNYLLSRMIIIDLPGYNVDQKKEIANKIIQKWFTQNKNLNQNNFEISSDALETLINKTKEKGVRQLKTALDNIFEYCILQWSREARNGELERKIKVSVDLVNQIIPHDFSNIDQEEDNTTNNLQDKLRKLQQSFDFEINDLKKKIQNLQEKEKINWKIGGGIWFFLFIVFSLIFGLPLALIFLMKNKNTRKKNRN